MITHPVRFFFQTGFPQATDFDVALPGYIGDMNTILNKNTDRKFAYAGYRWISTMPSVITSNVFPATDYEYHVFVAPAAPGEPQGGGQAGNQDGNAVCFGCRWSRLWHPPLVDVSHNLTEYWWQNHVMLHEFGHACGAAVGEYYPLWKVDDSTRVEPIIPIDGLNPSDPFWRAREDWKTDPMLVFGGGNAWWTATTRREMLEKVKFSDATASIINGHFREALRLPCANIQAASVLVLDENKAPLPGARVRVWHVDKDVPKARLLKDTVTGTDGIAPWSWMELPLPELSMAYTESVRCFKIHHPLYEPVVGYVTIYDAIKEGIDGRMDFTVEANMTPCVIPPFKLELRAETVKAEPTRIGIAYTLQEADAATGPWSDVTTLRAESTRLEFALPQPKSAQHYFRVRANR